MGDALGESACHKVRPRVLARILVFYRVKYTLYALT